MFINFPSFLFCVNTVKQDYLASSETKDQLKRAFDKIKSQFEDQIEAINENTSEIQANYNLLKELEENVEHLRQQLEAIQLHLSQTSPDFSFKSNDKPYEIQPLSVNEKRVLVVILASASDKFQSYADLAKLLNLSESLVRSYITNMIEKGIPILKKYLNGKPLISIDEKFKELQEKCDIAKLAQKRLNSF